MVKTIEMVVCRICGHPIVPGMGFILTGLMSMVGENVDDRGVFLGDLPLPDREDSTVKAEDITSLEVASHWSCFRECVLKSIGLESSAYGAVESAFRGYIELD